MAIFAVISTLFVVGSLFGWILEVFFRRFFSQHRWMNPGFLTGPYLPIYGFGVIGLYGLSELFRSIAFPSSFPHWVTIILQILLIGIVLIAIEFIAGLIFIKGMGLKLWDYSDRWGNTMGIVCPLFDLLWTAAGAIYYFFIHPILRDGILWIAQENHNIYYLFIGVVLGMMIVDFAYSFHLATAMRNFAKTNKVVLKLSEVQLKLKDNQEKLKKKFFVFPSIEQIKESLAIKKPPKEDPNQDNQEG